MIFQKLTCNKIVFEVRFDLAPLYWDNSGRILHVLREKYPDFAPIDVNVSSTRVRWPKEQITIAYTSNQCNVDVDTPSSTKKYKEICDFVYALAQENLQFKVINRVGCRIIMHQSFANAEEKYAQLNKLCFFGDVSYVPSNNNILDGASPKDRGGAIKIENESIGYRIGCQSEERDLTLNDGGERLGVQIDKTKYPSHVISYDIDRYTLEPQSYENIIPSSYVRISERVYENDGMQFWKERA